MSEPHERLNEAMNARRRELRMQWNQLAAAAGVSAEALRAIRRGDYSPSDLTALRLDEAFQWEPGSVERILATPPESEVTTPSTAAEAKVPAVEDEEDEIDWETFVPQTAAEKALVALYRASQRSLERRLDELSERVDRIAPRDEGGERRLA